MKEKLFKQVSSAFKGIMISLIISIIIAIIIPSAIFISGANSTEDYQTIYMFGLLLAFMNIIYLMTKFSDLSGLFKYLAKEFSESEE